MASPDTLGLLLQGVANVTPQSVVMIGVACVLLYLGIVTTFVAQWLQALGQSRVKANDAAVIYALDPVYAAGFSYLLLGETLGQQGLIGAGVVFAAVLLSRSSSDIDAPDEAGLKDEVNDAKTL